MGSHRAHYIPTDYQDLYETYFDPSRDTFVRGLTRRYAGRPADDADVEDLMHLTFERMLRLKSLEKFDPARGNFGLYLQQIIRSVVYNWHKKNGRTPTLRTPEKNNKRWLSDERFSILFLFEDSILRGLISEMPTPEEAAICAELERRLFEAAEAAGSGEDSTLRGGGLAPMLAVLINGGEAKEVAESLGVSSSTITHWRRHLRDLVSA